MNYTLYIANFCPACKRVEAFIQENNIDCDIINLDDEEVDTPMPIMIFPALVGGDKLLAYGCDIRPMLEKKFNLA